MIANQRRLIAVGLMTIALAFASTSHAALLFASADCDPALGPASSGLQLVNASCEDSRASSAAEVTYRSISARTSSNVGGDFFASGTLLDEVFVTPNDAALEGQAGKLFLTVAYEGVLSYTGSFGIAIVDERANNYAPVSYEYTVDNGRYMFTPSGTDADFGSRGSFSFRNQGPDAEITGLATAEFDITFGERLDYRIVFTTAIGGTRHFTDFTSGLTLSSAAVTDSSLTEVDATLLTAGGVDLNNLAVVPVPPAVWLFGSALAALFLRRR